jgi:acetate CoA/acetoacetate CoA-transferase alpha subunit
MATVSLRSAIKADEAAQRVPDGASVMIGGFMGVGTPERLIDALVARKARNLTVIANDTARPGLGIGKLIDTGCVSRVIVSHIGTNLVTQRKMLDGTLAVDLVPQGTLAERIRAGGAGLGGILTPTGVGTVVAEGKRVITVDGKDYLLELPLRADVALGPVDVGNSHSAPFVIQAPDWRRTGRAGSRPVRSGRHGLGEGGAAAAGQADRSRRQGQRQPAVS